MDWDTAAAKFGATPEIDWDEAMRKFRGVEKPSLTDQFMRQAGLTARHIAEGAAGVAGIAVDPINKLRSYVGGGYQPLQEATSNALTSLGLPQAQGEGENLAGAVSRGMVGAALPIAGAGRGVDVISKFLRAQPGAQAAGAASGAGASEYIKQEGGGAIPQAIGGAVASMVPGGAGTVLGMGARGGRELARPATQAGREQIAADLLGKMVQDRTGAIERLSEYKPAFPAAPQTAAAASRDMGLAGMEQTLSRNPAMAPDFASRAAEQAQAQTGALKALNATEKQIEVFTAKREQLTTPLREMAFAGAKKPVDFQPVAERVGELLASPAGGRAETEKAIGWIAKRLDRYEQEGRLDARNAYALHQDIGDLVAGKVKDENGAALRLAGGMANEIKKSLAQEIERVAPGFKRYLNTYSRLSEPIDRLETIKERIGGETLSRVTNAMPMQASPMAPEVYALSQNKVRNAVNDLGQMPRQMAPRQQQAFDSVLGDLNAQTFAARAGKQPGSDTFQNLAANNFLNNLLGETIGQSKVMQGAPAKALGLLSGPMERAINEELRKAFLDPKKMEELLRKARTQRAGPDISFAIPEAWGGLLGLVQ